jgi:hypothetical protein
VRKSSSFASSTDRFFGTSYLPVDSVNGDVFVT